MGSSCRPADVVAWVFAPTLLPALSPLPPPLDGSFQRLTHRPTFPGRDDPGRAPRDAQRTMAVVPPRRRVTGTRHLIRAALPRSTISNRRDGGDGMKIMWRWSEEAPGCAPGQDASITTTLDLYGHLYPGVAMTRSGV
jgi:hypothetical protein